MEQSLHFYVEGLGFTIENRWIVEGKLRWCWLALGGAALMLQEMTESTRQRLTAKGALGTGSALYFQCKDALVIYHQIKARGFASREPQVGNYNWEVSSSTPTATTSTSAAPPTYPKKPSSPKSSSKQFYMERLHRRVPQVSPLRPGFPQRRSANLTASSAKQPANPHTHSA
jgi:lactoylglutathione lyase